MYIRSLEIKNIRSIEHFEMTFSEGKEAGWHVLIGDNGSGKSTIVKSMALALLGSNDIFATRENWSDWLKKDSEKGNIELLIRNNIVSSAGSLMDKLEILSGIEFIRMRTFEDGPLIVAISIGQKHGNSLFGTFKFFNNNMETWKGKFSAAYGPFRRFSGGNSDKEKLFQSHPRLGAHLSIFGEDVALSEALNYIRELYIKNLEKKDEWNTLDSLIKFINSANLLPHTTSIHSVDSENVYFTDGNGNQISAVQMSDGFRSVLSLTFELIRQLIRTYGAGPVFSQVREGNMVIDLPGVVLVDEIDVHLHPTWQTRIGNWFLKYFPNLQFIVTTHSPLVCRACEKGSIWRLAAPGSNQESGEVTGLDRERLIYGNVLDAYGTELFGQDVERSDQSQKKLERLAHLSQLNAFGKISDPEKKEMQDLRKILITDDTTTF